jgi:hypothetical protein
MKYTLLFLVWAVITISFTIGMVLDVKLGLKVLGYGYAALICTCVIFCVFFFCWVSYYVLPNFTARTHKMLMEQGRKDQLD